ncbi:MAG: hypothetical protein ACRDR6_25740, partial [Pseudonocardiaceae bacterium]
MTDRAQGYLRGLDELLPSAHHVREKYANDPDHDRFEVLAATDARPEMSPPRAGDQLRACVHPEPS